MADRIAASLLMTFCVALVACQEPAGEPPSAVGHASGGAEGLAPADDEQEREAQATGGCVRAGCSSQLCVPAGDEPMTTCEFRPEYACYRQAACERQPDGQCGFTPTPALEACLANPPAP